jgi:hypothetical protein
MIVELTYYLFTAFNGLRLVSYLPQIWRVAKDQNGASAIAYSTWGLWTAANASTAAYAAVNLGDATLAVVSTVNTVCCTTVIVFTAIKRRQARQRKRRGPVRGEPTTMHLIARRMERRMTPLPIPIYARKSR